MHVHLDVARLISPSALTRMRAPAVLLRLENSQSSIATISVLMTLYNSFVYSPDDFTIDQTVSLSISFNVMYKALWQHQASLTAKRGKSASSDSNHGMGYTLEMSGVQCTDKVLYRLVYGTT